MIFKIKFVFWIFQKMILGFNERKSRTNFTKRKYIFYSIKFELLSIWNNTACKRITIKKVKKFYAVNFKGLKWMKWTYLKDVKLVSKKMTNEIYQNSHVKFLVIGTFLKDLSPWYVAYSLWWNIVYLVLFRMQLFVAQAVFDI